VKVRRRPRIVVIYNRDFEGAEADPENRAREDVKDIADDILRVLNASGFEATGLGITGDVMGAMATLVGSKPDAVFNLCESIRGDNRFESLMPLLMDLASIPYTGSCSFALSLALRKEKVKEVLRAQNVPVPRGGSVTSVGECAALQLSFPVIVKPAREDASVGISSASVVGSADVLEKRVAHVLENYRQPALVEEFIEGREIYVSLLDRRDQEPRIFPFFEIDFSDMPEDRPKIVSFEGKWVENSLEYMGTRPIRCEKMAPDLRTLIGKTALDAFRAIGLRDYARIDLRVSPDGNPYVIDVNPNCDLSDLAGGYSRAAKAAGLSYRELILHILGLALARQAGTKGIAKLAGPASVAPPEGDGEARRDEARASSQRDGAGSA
jgi:D-alanine-D-alanine ligase